MGTLEMIIRQIIGITVASAIFIFVIFAWYPNIRMWVMIRIRPYKKIEKKYYHYNNRKR